MCGATLFLFESLGAHELDAVDLYRGWSAWRPITAWKGLKKYINKISVYILSKMKQVCFKLLLHSSFKEALLYYGSAVQGRLTRL